MGGELIERGPAGPKKQSYDEDNRNILELSWGGAAKPRADWFALSFTTVFSRENDLRRSHGLSRPNSRTWTRYRRPHDPVGYSMSKSPHFGLRDQSYVREE